MPLFVDRPRLSVGAMALCALLSATTAATEVRFERVSGDISQVNLQSARSAAFGDYNNDGWPDLFLLANNQYGNTRHALLAGDGRGTFTLANQTITSPVSGLVGGGAIWGDYDNDGDLDLFVPRGAFWVPSLNLLLRNDAGRFVDVATMAGLTDVQGTDNAVWLDYDRDGWLDLYTGNLAGPENRNLLYRNLGDGTFADVTDQAGLDEQLHAELGGSNGGMIAADFSGDDWPDLYVAVFAGANRLYLNDRQGGFVDATTPELGNTGEAFGLTAGDVN